MSLATAERPSVSFTVQLDAETAEALGKAAKAREVRAEELIAESVDLFLSGDLSNYEFSDEDIAAIERGIEQARRGESVDQEVMMARLSAKYGG